MFNSGNIRELQLKTGCGIRQCKDALDYSDNDFQIATAYLKARSFAVSIKGKETGEPVPFDERVKYFTE